MGEEKLDTKLSMKEKIISFLLVFSIVSFCVFSANLTREQSFEYRRKSGWYEQHPNKPSLLGRIENWFREKTEIRKITNETINRTEEINYE